MASRDTHDVPTKSPYGLKVVWWLTTTEFDDVLSLHGVEFTVEDLAILDKNQLHRKVDGPGVVSNVDNGFRSVPQRDIVDCVIWVSLPYSNTVRHFTYLRQNIERQ